MYFILVLLIVVVDCVEHFHSPSGLHHLAECSPTNLKISDFKNAYWELESDGTFKLAFHHCKLRIFSAIEAKKCLHDTHLLMMGDSISRYLYMSLVSFLSLGHWSTRVTHTTEPKNTASLMWEKDFPSWGEYYRVSNAVLNNVENGCYELCDCYREDGEKYRIQQETMIENRHFRAYSSIKSRVGSKKKLHNSHSTPGDHSAESMVRVSYIQYYGSQMSIRGRSKLSTALPLEEEAYKAYVNEIGSLLCPFSILPENRIFTQDMNGRVNNYPNLKNNMAIATAVSGLMPMTKECGVRLNKRNLMGNEDQSHTASDASSSDGDIALDFPPLFWNDTTGELDRKVLAKLNITHLLLNLGWHAPFANIEANGGNYTGVNWLLDRLKYSKLYSNPSDMDISLPRVTWRGSTSPATWGMANDAVALNVFESQHAQSTMGLMQLWELTDSLWHINRWINHNRGKVDIGQLILEQETLKSNPEMKAGVHGMHEGRGTDGNHTDIEVDQTEILHQLKFNISPKLHAIVRSINTTMHNTIPKSGRFRSYERLYVERSSEGNKLILKLYPIFLDHAHPQPWVYNEINNVFLNSICN